MRCIAYLRSLSANLQRYPMDESISQTVNIKRKMQNQAPVIFRKLVPDFCNVIWKLQVLLSDIFSIDIIYDHVCCIGNIKFACINRQLILAGVFPHSLPVQNLWKDALFSSTSFISFAAFFLINTVPFHYSLIRQSLSA